MLFHFERIQCSVFFNHQIDLVHIFVAVEIQRRFNDSLVIITLNDLGDHEALKESTGHSAVFQNIRRIPPGKVGRQPGIQEIQLWSLYCTLGNVGCVWLQQINNVGGYKNRKPSFRCRLTDPDIPCHRGKVDELPGGRCGSRHKASKFHGVSDLGQVTDIPFNICSHICAIKHLPIKIRILTKLRHRAAVDHLPYLLVWNVGKLFFALVKIRIRRQKRCIIGHTVPLTQRKTKQGYQPDSAGQ